MTVSAHIQPAKWVADEFGEEWHEDYETGEFVPDRSGLSVRVTHCIEEVEAIWRDLCASGIESPGQSYDFIRLWVKDRNIPQVAQHYVVGEVDGAPVALLPLHLKRVYGVRILTWFPGTNAGCYAPIADQARLAAIGPVARAELWKAMTTAVQGADLVYLRAVPVEVNGHRNLFADLGSSLAVDTLYRARFSSWTQCDSEQRSRSRRKHDRQQGERLAALGEVAFEVVSDPETAHEAIETMFTQRSARFRNQGIRDCFVEDRLIDFYHAAYDAGSGIDVMLHTLRLDGQIVAVRYNIVHGERIFCLISSMSDCSFVQSGSPGKQCLLRAMQTIFDEGYTVFDMGAGLTDEKRHWCNVQIPLRQHYIGLTFLGKMVAATHWAYQAMRARAKSSSVIKSRLRAFHQAAERLLGRRGSNQL